MGSTAFHGGWWSFAACVLPRKPILQEKIVQAECTHNVPRYGIYGHMSPSQYLACPSMSKCHTHQFFHINCAGPQDCSRSGVGWPIVISDKLVES